VFSTVARSPIASFARLTPGLLAVLLFGSIPSLAAQTGWRFVAASADGDSLFLAMGRLEHPRAGIVQTWSKVRNAHPERVAGAAQSIYQTEFWCTKRMARNGPGTDYGSRDEPLVVTSDWGEWQPLIPGSWAEAGWRLLCRRHEEKSTR